MHSNFRNNRTSHLLNEERVQEAQELYLLQRAFKVSVLFVYNCYGSASCLIVTSLLKVSRFAGWQMGLMLVDDVPEGAVLATVPREAMSLSEDIQTLELQLLRCSLEAKLGKLHGSQHAMIDMIMNGIAPLDCSTSTIPGQFCMNLGSDQIKISHTKRAILFFLPDVQLVMNSTLLGL